MLPNAPPITLPFRASRQTQPQVEASESLYGICEGLSVDSKAEVVKRKLLRFDSATRFHHILITVGRHHICGMDHQKQMS